MTEELTALKATADSLEISYPANIGLVKLQAKIDEALNAKGLQPHVELTTEEIEAAEKELNEKEGNGLAVPSSTQRTRPKNGRISKAMKMAQKKKEPRKSKRVKRVEIWVTTPFQLPLTNPETGKAMLDEDGDALAITKLACCPSAIEAKRLIKKYQANIDIDTESGEVISNTSFGIASTDEREAYDEEMAVRRKFRLIGIKARRLRNAKHIVNVTQGEVEASA